MSDLESRLMTWASGSFGTEAAIQLLADHNFWLQRPDFLAAAITGGEADARIDWRAAFEFCETTTASAGELIVLRAACSLADPELTIGLGEVGRLDARNLKLVQASLRDAKFGVM